MRIRYALIAVLLGLLTGCAQTATIPQPPPGYVAPPSNPKHLSECNWHRVETESKNKAHVPSLYTLNCMVLKALDPNTTIAQKRQLLAGNIKKSLLQRIGEIYEKYPYFTFNVVGPVEKNKRGVWETPVDIEILNNLVTLPAEIEYDGGHWKLAKTITCTLVDKIQTNSAQAKKDLVACFSDN